MKCQAYKHAAAEFEKNPLLIKEAKRQGRRVIGQFCLYTPAEIALAAGAISVSLCGTRNDTIAPAERFLPRSICPLIKSSFGFAVTDSCPYFAAADIVVADTTCDGKKKMYELLAEYKPVHVLQLPQRQDGEALAWWEARLHDYVRYLEHTFETDITDEKLSRAIGIVARERSAIRRLCDLAGRRPSAITGMELAELVSKASFHPDKEREIDLLNAVCDELEQLSASGSILGNPDAPRIILTGTPIGMGAHKVVSLIEECGGSAVCLDNCSIYKKTRISVDRSKPPLAALAEAYLGIPCSVMSPNPNRFSTLRELAEKFEADAVIDLAWQGCQTYAIEAHSLRRFVRGELGIPYLNIETDYSSTDTEQLKVRIEAFLEMLG